MANGVPLNNGNGNAMHPLTIEYLQLALREAERNDTLVVTNMSRELLLSFEEHFIGEVYRVKLTYNITIDENITVSKSVIVKVPYRDDVNVPNGIFRYESNFYNNVLSPLECAFNQELPVIRSIRAEENVVVTNDFMDDGWVFPKLREGANQEQSEQVMRTLAQFHSASLIMVASDDSPFDRLSLHVQDQIFNDSNATVCKRTIGDSFAVAKYFANAHLPKAKPDETAAIRRFLDINSDDLYNAAKVINEDTPENRRVFVHGECWAHNYMLKGNNSGDHALLINLPTVCQQSPARDLVYFFATNPQTINTPPLLRLYDQELQLQLEKHDVPRHISERFPMEILRSEVERFKPFGLLVAIWILVGMSYTSYPSVEDYNNLDRDDKPQLVAQHIDREFYIRRLIQIIVEYA